MQNQEFRLRVGDYRVIYTFDHMLAEFDNMLIRLEQTIPRCIHVRTQGTLKDSDWANELHPTTQGFKKIAARYQQALVEVFPILAKP